MQMLKKMFNSDSKYYLELDEAAESKAVQETVKAAKKTASVVQEKTAEVIESKPVQKAVKAAKETANAGQEKLESVAKDGENKAKSAKNAVKGQADKKDSSPSQAQTKPSPKNAGASSFDPPFWVAAMYNNSSAAVNEDGTRAEQTFATDNLMPTVTKSRRRPGPSLNKFKDMASKAKTPKG